MNRGSVDSFLRARGLRVTLQRVRLLDALADLHRPVSAEELHREVRAIDVVTVYRVLQRFVNEGIAREVRFKDGVVRYEFAGSPHHHHVVCTKCGLVDELQSCDAHQLEAHALTASKRFAQIDEHALEFFGTCTSCATK
ncbi:MAG TPA: Fur family transcriptional regulator [Candidatus Paceibacterota bacterium]|nr:Fur family transcriptional regulator [Candidatus Paceibacterota bacterium]